MLKFLDSCSISVQLAAAANDRSYFTNLDQLQGFVVVKTKSAIAVSSLKVFINVGSSTILFDNKGTFLTCENRSIFTSSLAIVVDRKLPAGAHRIPFRFSLPGSAEKSTVFNLPPSMKSVDGNKSTKIDYTVDATLHQENHHPLNASCLFKFLPQPQYTSYSLLHNSALPASATDAGFSFVYSGLQSGVNDMPEKSKISPFRRFSSRDKSLRLSASQVNMECPFAMSVDYHHAKVNGQGGFAKGVINVPTSLSDCMSFYLISKYSGQEIHQQLFDQPDGTYPERIRLTSVRIDLETVVSYCCGNKIIKSKSKSCVLGRTGINYSIDLAQFKHIKTKQGDFYRYELDPSIFGCVLRQETCSFISSSVKVDHQLQFATEFASATSDNKATANINTDVLILNQLLDD